MIWTVLRQLALFSFAEIGGSSPTLIAIFVLIVFGVCVIIFMPLCLNYRLLKDSTFCFSCFEVWFWAKTTWFIPPTSDSATEEPPTRCFLCFLVSLRHILSPQMLRSLLRLKLKNAATRLLSFIVITITFSATWVDKMKPFMDFRLLSFELNCVTYSSEAACSCSCSFCLKGNFISSCFNLKVHGTIAALTQNTQWLLFYPVIVTLLGQYEPFMFQDSCVIHLGLLIQHLVMIYAVAVSTDLDGKMPLVFLIHNLVTTLRSPLFEPGKNLEAIDGTMSFHSHYLGPVLNDIWAGRLLIHVLLIIKYFYFCIVGVWSDGKYILD